MRRFEAAEGWGTLPARNLMPIAVQSARDAMKETPVMANQMLSVGRTIWDWAIPLDLAKDLPCIGRNAIPQNAGEGVHVIDGTA